MNRKCNKCNQIKDISCFSKSTLYCKECRKKQYSKNKKYYIESAKTRYIINKENILEKSKIYQKTSSKPKEWRENNKEYLQNKAKEWYKINKDKALKTQYEWRENNKEYFKEWFKNNPDKVKQANKRADIKKRRERPWEIAWRNQLGGVLKRLKQIKINTTLNSLGYSSIQLKEHIESLWVEGMDWGNYGRTKGCWEIDHKIPVSSFNWNTKSSLVNSLDNLQPMWVTDNRKKSNKIL